jgi:hypothetical protein
MQARAGLAAGTAVVAAPALTTGGNIPADASDDPSTAPDDDPTAVAVTVAAVPTLDAMGLVALGRGLAAAGLAVGRRRRMRTGDSLNGRPG